MRFTIMSVEQVSQDILQGTESQVVDTFSEINNSITSFIPPCPNIGAVFRKLPIVEGIVPLA